MATLIFVITAALFARVSANPDALQQLYGTPNVGSLSTGSSAPANVRSDFIPRSSSSASSSDSGVFPSPFTADGSISGRSVGISEGSSLSGSTTQPGITLTSSQNVDSILSVDGSFDAQGFGDVTITQETTVDVFKTVTNVIYNSIPITLTEFVKTTVVQPISQVLSTLVDDHVFVATAPVTRTDSVTVTNTNTGYFYATEVSTDTYTITHKAYEILQTTVTSTLQQTQVFRPTIVRTRINTEYETQTVEYFVTNTIVIQPRSTLSFGLNPATFNPRSLVTDQQGFEQGQQGLGNQQGSGLGQQIFGNQQASGLGQQGLGNQQGSGQGQQIFGNQQGSGLGQQGLGNQQGSGQGLQGLGNQQGPGQEQQGLGNQQGPGQGQQGFGNQQGFGQSAVGRSGKTFDLREVSEDEERRLERNMHWLLEHGRDSLKVHNYS